MARRSNSMTASTVLALLGSSMTALVDASRTAGLELTAYTSLAKMDRERVFFFSKKGRNFGRWGELPICGILWDEEWNAGKLSHRKVPYYLQSIALYNSTQLDVITLLNMLSCVLMATYMHGPCLTGRLILEATKWRCCIADYGGSICFTNDSFRQRGLVSYFIACVGPAMGGVTSELCLAARQ